MRILRNRMRTPKDSPKNIPKSISRIASRTLKRMNGWMCLETRRVLDFSSIVAYSSCNEHC